MSITANVGGTLKALTKITSNVSGTLKALNSVHANVSGTLKQIYSAKPTTITGSAVCTASTTFKKIATNVNIPTTCTVTFNATIEAAPSYDKGARVFQAINASGEVKNFTVTTTGDTDMKATASLPAGVYTFQMLVNNVHTSQGGQSFNYPTVTYTITFS